MTASALDAAPQVHPGGDSTGHADAPSLWSTVSGNSWLLSQWMRRDYTVRYRQSLLGLSWAIIQPLFLLAVYGLVFTHALHVHVTRVPYVVFAYTGLAPWAFVATALSMGIPAVLNAQGIITKVWFERSIIPLSSVGVSTIDLGISTFLMLVLSATAGSGLHLSMLALFPVYAALLMATAGLTVAGAAVTVFVRDIRQALPLILQLVFIASPIMYPVTTASGVVHLSQQLNPLAIDISDIRMAVIDGTWPHPGALALNLVLSAAFLLGCLAYFRAVESRFPDVL